MLRASRAVSEENAIDLLDSRRFDIPAKTLCARYVEKTLDSNWGVEVYAHHLEVWNGLHELAPVKNGLQEYIDSYKEILEAVKQDRFDFKRWPVSLDANGAVIDGSHRLAAAIYYGKRVKTRDGVDGKGQICPWSYLKNRKKHVPTGLQEKYADAMAQEYMKLKQGHTGLFVVMLFPSAQGHDEQVAGILEDYGRVVYDKSINFTANGAINLIRQVYFDEAWLGTFAQGFPGANSKAAPCFAKRGPMRVYLVESDDTDGIMALKQRIRDVFEIENHSVHINDTNEETFYLANMLFNRNTLHFLNHATLQPDYDVFNRQFAALKRWVDAARINRDDLCVDASSTLSAYGLRQGRDIDFLHAESVVTSGAPPDVNSHNDWAHHYDKTIDDILYNPTNHFYYDGIKFTTPEVVRAMKHRRGEKKDIRDCALLDSLPSRDVQLSPEIVHRTGRRSGMKRFIRALRGRLRPDPNA